MVDVTAVGASVVAIGAVAAAPAFTARATLSRPPVTVLPASEGSGSTPPTRASFTCCAVHSGWRVSTSAAAPATWGVAMDVPLYSA